MFRKRQSEPPEEPRALTPETATLGRVVAVRKDEGAVTPNMVLTILEPPDGLRNVKVRLPNGGVSFIDMLDLVIVP